MKLTILGNNSALPGFGRHPTSQALTVGSEIILIDCGEGTQEQMQRYSIKWKKIHNILISHLHGDHYFGLPGLLNSMSLNGRLEPLHLFAPPQLQPIIEMILNVADTVLSYQLIFHELPVGAATLVDDENITLKCFPVKHRIDCHGFSIATKYKGRRILAEQCERFGIPFSFYPNLRTGADFVLPEGVIITNDELTEPGHPPKMYAFSADTVYTEDILPHVSGADTLYHESTYLHEDLAKAEARFHSTALQAAQIALAAGVGQLLLGHFSSKYKDLSPFGEEAAQLFPNVQVTVEGVTYDI